MEKEINVCNTPSSSSWGTLSPDQEMLMSSDDSGDESDRMEDEDGMEEENSEEIGDSNDIGVGLMMEEEINVTDTPSSWGTLSKDDEDEEMLMSSDDSGDKLDRMEEEDGMVEQNPEEIGDSKVMSGPSSVVSSDKVEGASPIVFGSGFSGCDENANNAKSLLNPAPHVGASEASTNPLAIYTWLGMDPNKGLPAWANFSNGTHAVNGVASANPFGPLAPTMAASSKMETMQQEACNVTASEAWTNPFTAANPLGAPPSNGMPALANFSNGANVANGVASVNPFGPPAPTMAASSKMETMQQACNVTASEAWTNPFTTANAFGAPPSNGMPALANLLNGTPAVSGVAWNPIGSPSPTMASGSMIQPMQISTCGVDASNGGFTSSFSIASLLGLYPNGGLVDSMQHRGVEAASNVSTSSLPTSSTIGAFGDLSAQPNLPNLQQVFNMGQPVPYQANYLQHAFAQANPFAWFNNITSGANGVPGIYGQGGYQGLPQRGSQESGGGTESRGSGSRSESRGSGGRSESWEKRRKRVVAAADSVLLEAYKSKQIDKTAYKDMMRNLVNGCGTLKMSSREVRDLAEKMLANHLKTQSERNAQK